ncbi:MAG TPA: hypothetical protein VNR61_14635, partial [Niallia sp.]|nr:hypothetical protein [Niallia sp.]
MGFKEEFKHEMKNVMKDIEKEVHKTWTFEYKGHVIEVINQMKEESLIIDGVTVVHKKRKHLLSHIIPYSKLSSTMELRDGTKHTITVKLGGYVNLNCVVKINNETILRESSKIELLPWENKEKILPYIQQEIQENSRIIEDSLPDEEYFYRANQPRLVAGLFDQLEAEPPTPFYVKKLMKLFKEQMDSPTIKTRKATYEKIISEHMASYRDELIEHLEQVSLEEEIAQQEAIWLLEHATHRDVMKFSILILGFTDCEKYKDLLFTIGMHEEFTPYVIFAWRNGMKNANEEIF